MAKKEKKTEGTDNKNKKKSRKNCNSNKSNNKNSKNNKKLSDFSYAELIILSSTLSYSIAEEIDEDDLAIFIIFLDILRANLELIDAQKVINAKSQPRKTEDLN